MVAASPCALAAAPLAYATAISACAKKVFSNLAQHCDLRKLLLNRYDRNHVLVKVNL